ncbi:PEP-CTERM sorting domain-containing protein (plasmid) [Vibrio alfacsensis]|uniref:PEP-CTERM sorting domain-containing protein n=1 Tax=Vibrio alfacsensis TaxID=1074311 RepID=A0ABN5PL02_9VIBR|nr:PEP-CTERM sorting domain-containing protein [Vibrio alfacsensis]AXY03780.1 PEP-CTERM sorting domain-containing protein [Vibrio alfacsensis]
MKKLVSTSIAVALLSSAFSTMAGVDRKLSLVGVDFQYDPSTVYNELGTELPAGDPKTLIDADDDGFDDATGTSMTFATFRDNGPTGGFSGVNDAKLADGTAGSDGKADGTFGELSYADPLESITVLEQSDPIGNAGVYDKHILTYDTQPIALDFRIVLEQGSEIDGTGIYQVEEKYSFFDILTQDGVKDWGLALDAASSDAATIQVVEASGGSFDLTLVFAGLAGELFDTEEGNNLPFDVLDPDAKITFSFAFQNQVIYDWNEVIEGSGDGNVLYRSAIPEPGSLGLIGLALAGFGVMQRRRKQK